MGDRSTLCSLERFEQLHVRAQPGRTLIVGSKVYNEKEDRRRRYADAVGVDMLPGDGVDAVMNLEEEDIASTLGQFMHVEVMSVLEHSRRPWLLAANLERALVPGGSLFVTVPFCWRVHAYPSDYYRFTIEGLRVLFENVDFSAAAYCAEDVLKGDRLPRVKVGGFPYFARTEAAAFGFRL
jgi:hypothetical protein